MKVKSVIKSCIIAVAFLCSSPFVNAQPGPGGPDPDPGNGTGVPIDGGLSILVAAGIGYAAKKRYDNNMKEGNVVNVEK